MKKVLIISYYWPPCGGAGVQRWAKFAKYLPEFGWEPIVYTPENPEMPVVDHSLDKDVVNVKTIKQSIWEPYSLYKKFTGQSKDTKIQTGFLKEDKKPGLTEKISVWLRGNLFIPDARKFWIKPSVKYLVNYLKEHPVDAVVSTGPPHSMHLIALGIKRKLNIPWLADFRDPWTNIDFYKDLLLSKWADNLHHQQEQKVLTNSDKICTIGNTMKSEFINKEIIPEKIKVITNGFDEDDLAIGNINLDKKFSIAHIGTLVPSRNPVKLWQVLKELVEEDQEFKHDLEIKLIGKTDLSVMEELKNKNLLQYLVKVEHVPHDDVIHLQQQSQLLVLLLNNTPNAKGVLTGKFFEYLASGRPIFCIGPEDGDVAEIIRETNSGRVVGFDDDKKMKEVLMQYYYLYKEKKLNLSPSGIEKYSRKNLTAQLSDVLNSMTK
jgi:glycosyltransferase involved in cell wall biosynthesis